ncbi:MAG: class I SAM-dependent rRNA methyltransferase [Kiritimatiellae bacterium]|nr:class I SAM-dependent rRNA methyltransferase [Kiritimatiellia bacterium]
MTKVYLRKGREKSVLRRHPWVFSGAVDDGRSGAEVQSGETVEVVDAGGGRLGFAWYSPQSQIRLRMVSFGAEGASGDGEGLVKSLVAAAVARRGALAGGENTAARLVNAESDGLPGVVADRYARHVVCQFTSAGAERNKAAIVAALMECVPGCLGVAERADADARRREGLAEGGFAVLAGEEPPPLVEIAEGPVRYLVDVRNGHKTGFYLDQRLAREAVAALARGRDVLNCFSYTGGFGLCAAAAGAASVTQVDASQDALDLAARNERLNAADAPDRWCARFDYVCADVFKYLRQCRDARRSWDLIVLDPPKFAETRSQLMKAARGYKDINLLAMKLLRPGGILASFSCSGAMDAALFDTILAEAAADAALDFQVVGRTGHAPDHPVALAFPEGRYLKGVILRRM